MGLIDPRFRVWFGACVECGRRRATVAHRCNPCRARQCAALEAPTYDVGVPGGPRYSPPQRLPHHGARPSQYRPKKKETPDHDDD